MWENVVKRLWLRHALFAAAALTAALLALISYESGALNALERQSVDARFAIRGSKGPDNRIAIVAVDTLTSGAIGVRPPIPRRYYAQVLNMLHDAGARLIVLDAVLGGTTDARDDQAILAAVRRDGPVVLGTQDDPARGPSPVPAGVKNAPGAVLGTTAVDTDPDAVLRRMMYIAVSLKTLAVRAAELVQGHAIDPAKFPDNHAWVDFRGPQGTFHPDSFIDVVQGRVPISKFAGKIVLIGITDPLGKDLFITPPSSVPMAGVEFNANALSTILDGFPLTPLGSGVQVLLLFLLAAVPALLLLRLAALYMLAAVIGVLLVFLVLVQVAFNSGTIVSVPDPILALVLGTIGAIAADSYVQRRQLRSLQEIFNLLPSPVSDFFISYRRGQSELAANTLREGLVRKFGEDSVFMDTAAIDPGQEWPRRLDEALAACRAMLVLMGPLWLDVRKPDDSRRLDDPADWVRREIETALGRSDIVVVPVLHDGAQPPSSDSLPETMRGLCEHQAVQFTGRDLEGWIDDLAGSIHTGRLRDSQHARESLATE
jgi:CHASE2 domain-containing sensor protein